MAHSARSVILGTLGLLFLAAVAYFAVNQTSLFQPPATPKSTELVSLVASSEPQTCTFDNGTERGKIFVADGKMKGEFVSKIEGGEQAGSVIVDGASTYLWSEGGTQGIILPYDSGNGNLEDAVIPTGFVDGTRRLDYECRPWKKNLKVFELPKDVAFSQPQGSQIQIMENQEGTESGNIIITPDRF